MTPSSPGVPLPAPHATVPPGPGVERLALASIVPAIVVSPNTAKTTGSEPVMRIVEPMATVRFLNGITTTSGPLVCACTSGVGVFRPHQLPNVRVVESKVDTPQSRSVASSAESGSSLAESKLLGV